MWLAGLSFACLAVCVSCTAAHALSDAQIIAQATALTSLAQLWEARSAIHANGTAKAAQARLSKSAAASIISQLHQSATQQAHTANQLVREYYALQEKAGPAVQAGDVLAVRRVQAAAHAARTASTQAMMAKAVAREPWAASQHALLPLLQAPCLLSAAVSDKHSRGGSAAPVPGVQVYTVCPFRSVLQAPVDLPAPEAQAVHTREQHAFRADESAVHAGIWLGHWVQPVPGQSWVAREQAVLNTVARIQRAAGNATTGKLAGMLPGLLWPAEPVSTALTDTSTWTAAGQFVQQPARTKSVTRSAWHALGDAALLATGTPLGSAWASPSASDTAVPAQEALDLDPDELPQIQPGSPQARKRGWLDGVTMLLKDGEVCPPSDTHPLPVARSTVLTLTCDDSSSVAAGLAHARYTRSTALVQGGSADAAAAEAAQQYWESHARILRVEETGRCAYWVLLGTPHVCSRSAARAYLQLAAAARAAARQLQQPQPASP